MGPYRGPPCIYIYIQEALSRTRAAIAAEEEVLAATQEKPEEVDPVTGDESQVLSEADKARIAEQRAAALERRRKLKAESAAPAAPANENLPKVETCAICQGPIFLEDREETQWLPCTHVFHKSCIEMWAETRGIRLELACPVCKNQKVDVPGFVVIDEGGSSSGSGNPPPPSAVAPPAASAAEAGALAAASADADTIV